LHGPFQRALFLRRLIFQRPRVSEGGGWLVARLFQGCFASEMKRRLLINPRTRPTWANTYSGRARARVSAWITPYWFALVTSLARHCVRSARVNTRTRSPTFETRARRAIASTAVQECQPRECPSFRLFAGRVLRSRSHESLASSVHPVHRRRAISGSFTN